MSNILLTGGRVPATLALARAFRRGGHHVFMAESLSAHLTQPSNALTKNFIVPSPRQQPAEFIDSLSRIIKDERIDLLIPCGEEVFYIARGRDQLGCPVFAESLKHLDILHNKWFFLVTAIELELFVPETILVTNEDDLLHVYAQWRDLIIKPLYSRFEARTMLRPGLKEALSTLTFDSSWVAQEHIAGRSLSAYSICQQGRVCAHAAYRPVFAAGPYAAIAIHALDHPEILKWVRTYVAANNFSGQLSMDFIETDQGALYALGCTPGATSGVHLLASNPKFVEAFLSAPEQLVTPLDSTAYMRSGAMLRYALPSALSSGRFAEWIKTFLGSDDVVFDARDPLPFLLQWRSAFSILARAMRQRISVRTASTFDVEWNGIPQKIPTQK